MASPKNGLSRRDFVINTSGLVVGFGLLDASVLPRLLAQAPIKVTGNPLPTALDSWLSIEADGMIRVFTGKVEIGMGVETALIQVMAEELDVAFERIVFVMGDTAKTPDQGGVGGSTSMAEGSKPLRNVAAAARGLLVELASHRLGVPVELLEVSDGIVYVKGDKSKRVSYAELTKETALQGPLVVSGAGGALQIKAAVKLKDPSTYKLVGKSIPRVDLPQKILGKWQYVTDVRVPGMLHGRVVRPASVGANLVSVDETAAKEVRGYFKTIVIHNFIGVLADNEWGAIQAAKALKIVWTDPQQPFCEQAKLYDYMRQTAPKASLEILKTGDFDAGMATATKKIEASYDYPFHAHATIGPGCGVADVHLDGVTIVWSGTQKPHALQVGIADLLKVSRDKVRVIWTEDSGSYGRAGFEDSTADAVMLSRAVGRPVRVQWMRDDMTRWGSKGPAISVDMAAGLDAQGKVTAFRYTSHAFSGAEIEYMPQTGGSFLAAQLAGIPNTNVRDEFSRWGKDAFAYPFPNVSANGNVVAAFAPVASSLRTTHLRDPGGMATTFATESFIDEMAAAAGVDPIEFRIANLDDDRMVDALRIAAKRIGWETRPSPRKSAASAEVVTGRGIAMGDRGGTRVATIAEVEVNRKTGVVRVKRLVCAHDCGLIVNPAALQGTIEGNLIQSLSRSLFEEVMFDKNNVTSVDWMTYPILRSPNLPDKVEVILINHPESPSSGAGEPSSRPTAAAVNNAIFDAIGVRVRQGPAKPVVIKAALAAAAQA